MIEEILKDLRELRNEMVQANWPAQRLSNIILKYEMKLQENKSKYTTDELVEATNKILNDFVLVSNPSWMQIEADFNPRGNVHTVIKASYGSRKKII